MSFLPEFSLTDSLFAVIISVLGVCLMLTAAIYAFRRYRHIKTTATGRGAPVDLPDTSTPSSSSAASSGRRNGPPSEMNNRPGKFQRFEDEESRVEDSHAEDDTGRS